MSDWIPFPWGKRKKDTEAPFDIEKYLTALGVSREGGLFEEEGVIYVKSIHLDKDSAIEDTIKEVDRGNIVILNMKDMLNNPIQLNEKVREIRDSCVSKGGDMCRISETKLMVIPQNIKIAYPSLQGETEF
jgi:SepF-like predicted cell division protein (DUF552 family)